MFSSKSMLTHNLANLSRLTVDLRACCLCNIMLTESSAKPAATAECCMAPHQAWQAQRGAHGANLAQEGAHARHHRNNRTVLDHHALQRQARGGLGSRSWDSDFGLKGPHVRHHGDDRAGLDHHTLQ